MQLLELIDRAAKVTRTEYQLAKQLGIEPRTITDWKAGRRTCSAEDRALLADIAGVDPFAEIAEAMLERWEGKPKGDRLATILRTRLEGVGKFYLSRIVTRMTARVKAEFQKPPSHA